MINEMTSKDKTLSKIEEMNIVFLIIHDMNELFICSKCTFNECEELLVIIIIRRNDILHEQILLYIEDECCS